MSMQQFDDDDLIDTDEVSQMTGHSRATFEGWRSRGKGGPPFYKFGHRCFYKRGDVKAWIEQHRIVPSPAQIATAEQATN